MRLDAIGDVKYDIENGGVFRETQHVTLGIVWWRREEASESIRRRCEQDRRMDVEPYSVSGGQDTVRIGRLTVLCM